MAERTLEEYRKAPWRGILKEGEMAYPGLPLILWLTPDGLLAHDQDQVAAISLQQVRTHHRIYLDPIPVGPRLQLVWRNELGGWRLEVQDG